MTSIENPGTGEAPAPPGPTFRGGEDVVLVAVPVAYVPHVARLIAELDAQTRPRPVPRLRSTPKPEHQGTPWPVEDLRRLSKGRSAAYRTVVAVLDTLAQHPGTLFGSDELARAAGTSRSKIIGGLAGLTRLLKAHYDYATLGLPFTRVVGRPDGDPKEIYYSIDEVQAIRWRQARADENAAPAPPPGDEGARPAGEDAPPA
ncbi:hypothetical protein ACIBXA_23690 [Micromonospora echinaurantiaca]|uniref:hypothetical protein n=1 Tax=Micromonospora TaxID=1873 RepID=UPI0018EEBBD2|nr:hypothetical protein [Micromonospora sp. S4605]